MKNFLIRIITFWQYLPSYLIIFFAPFIALGACAAIINTIDNGIVLAALIIATAYYFKPR